MNEKSILQKVRIALGIEVKLEAMKLDNGTMLEAASFEAGQDVMIITDDARVPLPVGEYTLEDGRVLVVTEEGVIGEIKEAAPAEEAPVAEPEMAQDAPAPQASAQAKKVIESVTKETVFSAEDYEALKAENESLKTQLAGMVKVDASKEEAKPEAFKHSPEKEAASVRVDFTNEGNSKKSRILNHLKTIKK